MPRSPALLRNANSYVSFAGPDGDSGYLQEVTVPMPGRGDAG